MTNQTIATRISAATARHQKISGTSDHIGAVCDAGQSIREAREALQDGDTDRAYELIVLAEEQIEAAES